MSSDVILIGVVPRISVAESCPLAKDLLALLQELSAYSLKRWCVMHPVVLKRSAVLQWPAQLHLPTVALLEMLLQQFGRVITCNIELRLHL